MGEYQKYNFCRDKHNFVATKVLSRQAYFCRDKQVFVATKHVFCPDTFVVTKIFCHDKLIQIVAASILLSRQKTCLSRQKLWQLPPMIGEGVGGMGGKGGGSLWDFPYGET